MEKCSGCGVEFPDLKLTEEQKTENLQIFCTPCYEKFIREATDKIWDHIDPKVMH